MTNREKLREVFPRTIFIYQKQDDKTCAIMCSDEWLDAEYTELNPNKDGVKSELDDFVSFLIRENCEGCKECEPRLPTDLIHDFVCVEEGRAKWLLGMVEKYKVESEGK